EAQVRVLTDEDATADSVRAAFADLGALDATDTLLVFLIGHGTYDGEHYKVNLKGPDITGAEFAELLNSVPTRSQLVMNATSASGAILEPWAADSRTLITATRSGNE